MIPSKMLIEILQILSFKVETPSYYNLLEA